MTYKQSPVDSDEKYRQRRYRLLDALCKLAKLMFPDAQEIVGIATEPGLANSVRSEDAMYSDMRNWTAEDEAEARILQEKTGFFTNVATFDRLVTGYPVPVSPNKLVTVRLKPVPRSARNSQCACGSGKKYKRCCGRGRQRE